MSERAQQVCEVAGGLLLIVGTALIYLPAAVILAGLGLVAVGNLPAPGRR